MDALRQLVFDIGFKGDTKDLIKTNKAVDDLKGETERASDKMDKLGKNISDIGNSSGKIRNIKTAFDDIGKAADKSSQKFKNMATSLSNISSKAGKLGNSLMLKVTTPISIAGGKMLKTAADFESGMSEVAAISGAAGQDLESLGQKARKLGKETGLGAGKSAEALKYMAMAGWDTSQMLGGLEGVMNLAAASGEDLGLVSDIVTDAMTAFGLSAEESTHFADVLATASSAANTNVAMMGDTFKYVAPVAGALGFSMEDTAVATGLMANSGVKAGQAGTALRGMFSKLVKPTSEAQGIMNQLGISLTDSQGKMKPFKTIMEDMRAGFSGLNEEQKTYYAATIFGQEAMSGALGVINASTDDFKKLSGAISSADGAAKRMAETKLDNLKGDMTKLKATFEEMAIELGELFIPSIREGIGHVTNLVEKFNSLDDGTKMAIVKMIGLAAATGPALKGFQLLTGGVGGLFRGISFLQNFKIIPLLTSITPATLPIIAVIGALIAAGFLLYKNWDLVKNKGIEFVDGLKNKFEPFIPYVQNLISNLGEIFKALTPVFEIVIGTIATGLGNFIETSTVLLGDLIQVFSGVTDFLIGVFTLDWERAWNGIEDIFDGVIKGIEDLFSGVIGFFSDVINKFKDGISFGENTKDEAIEKYSSRNLSEKSVRRSGNIPEFATGVTNFKGGLALVGEEGPELVNLPKGSNVINNRSTKEFFENSKSLSRDIYNSSVSTNSRNNHSYHFSPNITINTNTDSPSSTAERTKNKVRELFEEFIGEDLQTA